MAVAGLPAPHKRKEKGGDGGSEYELCGDRDNCFAGTGGRYCSNFEPDIKVRE